MLPERDLYDSEHRMVRDTARRFFADEVEPHLKAFDAAGGVPRDLWLKAGAQGLLCPQAPEQYGGVGGDFRFNAVIDEELAYLGGSAFGIACQNDLCCDYILDYGSEALRERWIPAMITGEALACLAMTEPGTGSDLAGVQTRAIEDGDHYVLSGQKTFITNGGCADIAIIVAKTDPAAGAKGVSLFLVEASSPGYRHGPQIEKIGMHGRDTAELFLDEVRVPKGNLLGEVNGGFKVLMKQLPQERLSIAIECMAWAQKAYDLAVDYAKERKAFGKVIFDFQNTRFVLADMKAQLAVGWAYLDQCILKLSERRLSVDEAAIAKLWITEMYGRVVDSAVQLHGGYGFTQDYLIGRMYCDARVQRIYGGTSEIMKDLIGRGI